MKENLSLVINLIRSWKLNQTPLHVEEEKFVKPVEIIMVEVDKDPNPRVKELNVAD